ncbi:MAG: glycosyltransferase, partial [Nanoarchaeota archaeon]
MKEKLKIGVITNSILSRTGLGRNAKCWLPILYKTGKYDIHFLSQGQNDNDPSFQKLPWKNFGVFKNFDQQRFNSDPNYQRIIAYSNTAVEDFVLSNKLQVVVALDDPWAFLPEFFFKTDWYKHMKDNFLIDITIDSEPVLPLIKEWAQNCPNIHFWSGFGKRVLEKEDFQTYKHIQILRGAGDGREFKPLPKSEQLQLRRSFGIKDDEKIIIYVFRNQLRKLAYSHMEALVEFKKKHPNKKIRLLYHTNISEPGGWPIPQIRDELKLDKEDLLVTYNCKACGNWIVKPFEGEDINCPHCNNQRCMVTPGVGATIDEHELNKIYNLADACASIFTSGGQENNCVESMLCGLPLACPDYSSGEDFVRSGLVQEIKGTFTRESNTSFKKFVPDIGSIVKFYEYIWNLSEEKRNDLVKRAREWAIKEFSPEVIAKQIETFIDSRKPIDWEPYFNKKKELKDPNAPIENIQDDFEFLVTAYERILKMMDMRDKTKPEIIHWMNFLNQPKDKNQLRNELISTFRNVAAQKNAEMQQISFDSLLLNNGKKNFLIVCPESASDCLYVSALCKSFRESYPSDKWNLYIGTKPEYMELFDCCQYIDKMLPFQDFMNNEIVCIGAGTNKKIFDGY